MAELHADSVMDVASSSNFHQLRTKNIHFDMEVNFNAKTITGSQQITFDVLQDGVKEVLLDVHEMLLVSGVTEASTGQKLGFAIMPFTSYGSTLNIQAMMLQFSAAIGAMVGTLCSLVAGGVPIGITHCDTLPNNVPKGSELTLHVNYAASRGPGVVWLDPAQTAGKEKPYLYTQGQAVMNRSFFPCQDTPAVKASYSATVKVPPGFTAVMSASNSSQGPDGTFHFSLTQPIASYLVALAVGDIVSAPIGPRSHVWAEPCILEAAKAEFDGEVEKFLSAGERLFGPYLWERYDLLIMPPSFPFGGMENPCLTFVTPCIVAGDKSLTDVVIHEISHSWFGNLVTNANWSEFWLNEGFTMFAERRIVEELFGRPTMCLEAATGQALLRQHMETTGMEHPLNRLRVVIEPGVDPDDTYNETPYEKGFACVSYLQMLAGSTQKFDNFLKAYVAKFQFKSIVAEDMFDFYLDYFPHLREHLRQQNIPDREGFEFQRWLNVPGWPPYTPDLSAGHELMNPPEAFSRNIMKQDPSTWPNIEEWTVYQVLHFLDRLFEADDFPTDLLPQLGKTYPRISAAKNSEIRLRWCKLVAKNNHQEAFSDVRDFLHSQGKQKYTRPLYHVLAGGSKSTRQLAVEVFKETCDMLHISVRNYVKEILLNAGLEIGV